MYDTRIDPEQPYGVHIDLTCRNHPHLRWFTKNIDYIGARSIFHDRDYGPECDCPLRDLVPVRVLAGNTTTNK